jgi:predicted DNA-binding transcriptional regulator AlpA
MLAVSEERLLRAVDVAAILSVPTKRVYELGIPAVRLSRRCLRWRRADVERWLEGRRVSS